MKIAILGTRGIPNYYGGFEQFAEYLSQGLVHKGHDVTVYNSHTHPYQNPDWNGVNIVHCYDPEFRFGTVGQFIYDFNCIMDSHKRNYDIILQLGYTSSSVWGRLLPRKNTIITTNMDGLEWKRSKYSKPVQQFILYAERLGVKFSDYLISDSIGIKRYLKSKYQKPSIYIPYGSHIFTKPDESILNEFNLKKHDYNMLIARLEPENSIEIILDGVALSCSKTPFLIIGNHQTKYGDYLKDKFKNTKSIKFLGSIYDIHILNNLRYFSNLYFHGHTVGGTNPSLLEAMASYALICAHDNIFNQSILCRDALYFKTKEHIAEIILSAHKDEHQNKISANAHKIETIYSWPVIIGQYMNHFNDIMDAQKKNDNKHKQKSTARMVLSKTGLFG